MALNLTAVIRALYRYHTNDVGRYFSELRRISLGEGKGNPRVLWNTPFLFAFPEEDFRSYLVVRSNMDLRNIGWDRALLEVAPEIFLVDDNVRFGQLPAFQFPPGCLHQFLSRYGTLRGTLRAGPDGPDKLVQVYALNLAAFARDSTERRTPEGRNGPSPPFPCAANSGLSIGGTAQRNGDIKPAIPAQ